MPKYTLHVPVYGSLDVVIDANDEQEVLEKYLEQKSELLYFENGILQEDLDAAYIVQINSRKTC
jgi:hypothetical protein